MINYYLLTKPGIIMGNLITVAAGFILASKGTFHIWLFVATLIGLTFIIASACVFNNYIDRTIDQKMDRTKNRPLVKGLISLRNALFFGVILALFGNAILLAYTNLLTLVIANVGFFVYVLLYSLWKGKTVHGTLIGSISGATPPVIGYCAASNNFDMGAFLLFLIMILWQMPHFFSIAMYRFDDYARAKIPVLPVLKGMHVAKVQMIFYIIGFILACLLLTAFDYTGYIYLIVATLLGFMWLFLGLKGFKSNNETLWAKQMFRFSLLTITLLCGSMSFF